MTAVRKVKLMEVPVQAFVAIQRHIDELFRELQVIEVGEATAVAAQKPELREVMSRILTDYAAARGSALDQAAQAMAQGQDRADVEIDLPPEAAETVAEFNVLLDRADQLCRSGDLLTLPESDAEQALRLWVAQEVERQLKSGSEPQPCPI